MAAAWGQGTGSMESVQWLLQVNRAKKPKVMTKLALDAILNIRRPEFNTDVKVPEQHWPPDAGPVPVQPVRKPPPGLEAVTSAHLAGQPSDCMPLPAPAAAAHV